MIGSANDGTVYATESYVATSPDELSFSVGDKLKVLRKGDNVETDWWWARLEMNTSREGYIPRSHAAVRVIHFCLTIRLMSRRIFYKYRLSSDFSASLHD